MLYWKSKFLGYFAKEKIKAEFAQTFLDSVEMLSSVYISKCKTNKALSCYALWDENWQ